jgi:uncharacterized repeat protein (TIGR02543 family)
MHPSTFTRLGLTVLLAMSLLAASLSQATPTAYAAASWPDSTAAPRDARAATLLQFTAGGHVLGFGAEKMYLASGSHALVTEFIGATGAAPQSDAAADQTGQAQPLTRVTYPGMWPGVTLIYDQTPVGVVKSTYIAEACDNASAIRLRYNTPVEVLPDGRLRFAFETGSLTESAPTAWQEQDGRRLPVSVAFAPRGSQEIGFAVDDCRPGLPLVIDPTITWHTFLGGAGSDFSRAIAVDGSGNIYVAGFSDATWGTPVNAFGGGTSDGFAAKLNSSGVRQWHTFMGGGDYDYGNGIAVDGSGNVYVGGYSAATWGTPVNAFGGGGEDGFAAKLNSSGVRQWHTFLGGNNHELWAIAVDGSGNVYVTGVGIPLAGTPVNPHAGIFDAFAVKLNSSGVRQWHTFLGGTGYDYGWAIAVDGSGNVYVSGRSDATWGTPVNAFGGGTSDAFAAKLDSSGVRQWHTFLGGMGYDEGKAIAVDGSGNIYVSGHSDATWGTPVNAFGGGTQDGFAAKLNSSGIRQWHTFLGGMGNDQGYGIAVDGSGNVYVGGYSTATWGTPVNLFGGGYDVFAAQLNSSGARQWHTFLGGDTGGGIAVDGSGNVYVAGNSSATWGTPVNPFGGGSDAFAAKISPNNTVTFDANGGTGTMAPQVNSVPAALNTNTFNRAGYTFAGWNTAANGSGTAYADGAIYNFSADITLYAQWGDGLILHWTFEEGSGTLTQDQTANNLDGTIFGTGYSWSTDVPPGSSGHSIYVGGVSSPAYVASAASALFPGASSPRSLCTWAKSEDGTVDAWADHIVNYGSIVTNGTFGFMIYTSATNTWWPYVHNISIDSGIVADTAWHHHCTIYDGTTLTYYLDGALFTSTSLSLNTTSNTPFLVGVRPDFPWDTYFDGWVDDVRLYNRALSAADVAQFMIRVTAVSPASNSHTAALTDNISFTADAALIPASVTPSTFTIYGGGHGQMNGVITASGGDTTFTDNPTATFFPGEVIQATITSGTGAASYVWQFRTATTAGTAAFPPDTTQPTFGNGQSRGLAVGDLNGDGFFDVAIAKDAGLAEEIWLNNGFGHFGAAAASTFGAGNSMAITLGDVDGDGDLDAVVAQWGAANEVWLNNGSGSFGVSPSNTFGSGSNWKIALGDIDGDGDLDAVVARGWGETEQTWLNNGGAQGGTQGNFSAHPTRPNFGAGDSLDVVLADLDNDGDLDAAVANDGGEAETVWLNAGGVQGGTPGDFGAAPFATFGAGDSRGLALGDVDADGDADLVIVNYASQPDEIWLNNGSGSFGATAAYTLGSASGDDAELGDVDGDGDLDLAVANVGQEEIWLNQGGAQGGTAGNFGATPHLTFSTDTSPEIALSDLNGDGTLDALVANWNQGSGLWVNPVPVTVTAVSPASNSHTAAISDNLSFTASAPLDPFSLDPFTFVVHGSAQGNLGGITSAIGGSAIGEFDPTDNFFPGEIIHATVTDGVLDENGTPLQPYVWQFRAAVSAGSGLFADNGQSLGNGNGYGIALGDLDGDGDLDAFLVNANSEPDLVYFNDGGIQGGTPGHFSDSGQNLGSTNGLDAALGDLDGDGDLDAVVANYGQPAQVYSNDGGMQGGTPGYFSDSGQSLGGNSDATAVALGDVDGDGDLDAVVVCVGSSLDRVYLNNGGIQGGSPGSFTDSGQDLGPAPTNTQDVALGDVDDDGDLDVFVVNSGTSPNQLFLNNGGIQGGSPGSFTDSGQNLGTAAGFGVALGDLDGDGDLDAFLTTTGSQPDLVYVNDGTGVFSDSGQSLGSSNGFAVSLGDLDGDGDLDAFAANSNQPSQVYINNGSGVFSDNGQNLGNFDSRRLALGDLDGDGDLDAYIANYNNQADLVWINIPPITAVDDSAAVLQNSSANTIDVLANDISILTLNIITVTQGTHGSIAITNGGADLAYTPVPGYAGSDTFTYTASDGLTSSTANVSVTITSTTLLAVDDSASVLQDSGANPLNVLANDASTLPMSITAVTQGAHGSVAITNGGANLAYAPNTGYYGSDSFTYTTSNSAVSRSATVNIVVLPTVAQPDLVIKRLRVSPTTVCRGQDFSLTLRPTNQGNLAAPAHSVALYNAAGPTPGGSPFGQIPISGLQAGQGKNYGLSTGSFITGTRYLLVTTDSGSQVAEFDELNNTSYVTITVQDDPAPRGNLVLNGGATFTNNRVITATLKASDSGNCATSVSQMRFSIQGSVTAWEPYTTTKMLTLPVSEGGPITIFAQFADLHNNASEFIGADIFLDVQPPNANITAPSGRTTNSTFTVTWQAFDTASGVRDFDIQVNVGNIGWRDWLTQTTLNQQAYTAQIGQTLCFQARARDLAGNVSTYPVEPSACVEVVTPIASDDLRPQSILLNQGIQTPANSVPLIAGRPLLVQVPVEAGAAFSAVAAQLHVLQGGQELTGSPLEAANAPLLLNPTPAEGEGENQFHFLLPSAWLSGTLEVYVAIDPANAIAESDESNNRFPANGSHRLTFTNLPTLELTLVPVVWQRGSDLLQINTSLLFEYAEAIQRLYPVGQVSLHFHPAHRYTASDVNWATLLAEIEARRSAELPNPGANEKYVALLPYPNPGTPGTTETPGLAYQPGSSVAIYAYPGGGEAMARQLAHTFGLSSQPVNTCPPIGNGTIGSTGWDFIRNIFLPPTTPDLMTGCPGAWVSPATYQSLLTASTSLPASTNAPELVNGSLLISGWLDLQKPGGQVSAAYYLDATAPWLPANQGDFSVELVDTNGLAESIRSFVIPPVNDPAQVAGQQPFAIMLPSINNLGAIRFYHQGTLLNELLPGPTPVVTITSSLPLTLTGATHTLTWQAEHAQSFLVRYSRDGGINWFQLSPSITTHSFVVDLAKLHGTENGIFEVIASGGLNSAVARQSGFRLPNALPQAAIFTPAPGQADSGATVLLAGAAFDLEDGILADEQLVWISNKDGILGVGQMLTVPLSPGGHVITLQVTDSRGQRVSVTVDYLVHRIFLPLISR